MKQIGSIAGSGGTGQQYEEKSGTVSISEK
jgi:hypothetical protein